MGNKFNFITRSSLGIGLVFVAYFNLHLVVCMNFISPKNQAVIVGEAMSMECNSGGNMSTVRQWSFNSKVVFSNWQSGNMEINRNFSRFQVNVDSNNTYILSTNGTQSTDAGVYSCYIERLNEKRLELFEYTAVLIVFDLEPFCETNLSSGSNYSLGEGDMVWMQCRVNVAGDWIPRVEWKHHIRRNGSYEEAAGNFSYSANTTIKKNISGSTSRSSITSTLIFVIDSTKNASYWSFELYFSAIKEMRKIDMKIRPTPATNIPEYKYRWRSLEIILSRPPDFTQSGIGSTFNPTKDGNSSTTWFLISLMLVVVVALAIVAMASKFIYRSIYRKKMTAAKFKKETATELLDKRTSGAYYDVIVCTDGYDTIEEQEITIPEFAPRKGPLPTPTYSCLMTTEPEASNRYTTLVHVDPQREHKASCDTFINQGAGHLQVVVEDAANNYVTTPKLSLPDNDTWRIESSYLKISDDCIAEIPSFYPNPLYVMTKETSPVEKGEPYSCTTLSQKDDAQTDISLDEDISSDNLRL